MKSIKKRIYFFLYLFLWSGIIFAQKQANNWIFGYKAGLTWNTVQTFEAKRLDNQSAMALKRIPTAIPVSVFGITNIMNAHNSSFALSDKNGNLQLYSDGNNFWKKSFGRFYQAGFGMSSTQGGVLMPVKPSSSYLDELIAIIPGSGYSGIDYLKIGFNYYYPEGTISVSRTRLANTPTFIGEAATVALKANKKDMWVIAPRMYQNKPQLYAWLLNESGNNQNFYTPVISEMVTLSKAFPSGQASFQTGFIKLSPDSRHFVWGTKNGYTILGEFDTDTGKASNVKYTNLNGYGVEFSRSGQYIYISTVNGDVYVYATNALLSAGNPDAIAPVYTYSAGTMGTALQLAPDGRIYQPVYNTRSLIVINKPEKAETDPEVCLLENILPDGGKVYLGLCNFSGSWFNSEIEGVEECCTDAEEVYLYSYAEGLGSDNVAYTMWDFGDQTPLLRVDVSGTSLAGSVSCPHIYTKPGIYRIKVYSYTSQGQLLSQSMEHTVSVRLCVIKVNPHIRGTVK